MKSVVLTMTVFVAAAMLPLAAGQAPQAVARQTWTVDGVERSALVAAPAGSASSRTGAPLVLVFHGHGGTSQHSARTYAIHTHWPDAVVIYAQGLPTPGRMSDPEGRLPGWQHAPGTLGDRDLKFTDAMLAWARTRYTIDPARVYAAGHSNGGTFTYVLWTARADTFAAFAASGSVFRRDLLPKAKPKPALIIAGEHDQLVPFAAQRASLDAVLRLNGAARSGQAWVDGAVLHRSDTGTDVAVDIYPGDHTMPANAGALMAKFFREHPR
jgi:polyhydroxybutyrate depolymerase